MMLIISICGCRISLSLLISFVICHVMCPKLLIRWCLMINLDMTIFSLRMIALLSLAYSGVDGFSCMIHCLLAGNAPLMFIIAPVWWLRIIFAPLVCLAPCISMTGIMDSCKFASTRVLIASFTTEDERKFVAAQSAIFLVSYHLI